MPDGWTPLHFAAQSGSVEVASCLLEHGAKLVSRNRIEQTPLHVAASNGHLAMVKLLLKGESGKTLLEMVDANGASPLFWAACAGQVSVVETLLAEANDKDAMLSRCLTRAVDSWGEGSGTLGFGANAAMVAALNGFSDVVEYLLDAGIPFQAIDSDGCHVLHYACLCTSKEAACDLVERLLDRAGSQDLVSLRDENGDTCLHVAVEGGCDKSLMVVFDLWPLFDRSLWSSANNEGNNLLHCLVSRAHSVEGHSNELIPFLLDKDPQIFKAFNKGGYTALHVCCEVGLLSDLEILLKQPMCGETEVNMFNAHGQTPLHLLCLKDFVKLEEALFALDIMIKHGASIMMGDSDGNTILHLAAIHRKRLMVRAILAHAACTEEVINAKNFEGKAAKECVTNDASFVKLFYPSNRKKLPKLLQEKSAQNLLELSPKAIAAANEKDSAPKKAKTKASKAEEEFEVSFAAVEEQGHESMLEMYKWLKSDKEQRLAVIKAEEKYLVDDLNRLDRLIAERTPKSNSKSSKKKKKRKRVVEDENE